MLRKDAALLAVACLTLAACGGGGGGGGTGIPPVLPSTAPSVPPPNGALGDVRQIAVLPVASVLAYDDDDRILLVSNATRFTTIGGTSPIVLPSTDASPYITAAVWSHSARALYFCGFNTVYKATAAGAVTTVGGGFGLISGIALDAGGTVYVIDGDHVATVSNGAAKPLTAAGTFTPPDLSGSSLATPQIAFDTRDGALYATDPLGGSVKRITPSGAVSIVAGSCARYAGGGVQSCWPGMQAGTGSGARFGQPSGIAYDAAHDVFYVSDPYDNVVWTMTPGGTTTIAAGYGTAAAVPGNGRRALMFDPIGVALSSADNLLYLNQVDRFAHTSVIDSLATSGAAPPAYTFPFVELATPSTPSLPQGLALAPDGSAWITEGYSNRIGHVTPAGITEFVPPAGFSAPFQITVDASGNAWSTMQVGTPVPLGSGVVRTAPDGTQTAYPFGGQGPPAVINGITTGADGNPWFGFRSNAPSGPPSSIKTIDRTSGAITDHPVSNAQVRALSAGPDANIWFYAFTSGPVLGRMAPDGNLVGQPFPIAHSAIAMTLNVLDHSLWYVDGSRTLGRVDLNGAETDTALCNACIGSPQPSGVAVAPDGTMWFTESNPAAVGHRDAAGIVTLYLLPGPGSGPGGIAVRADGKVWIETLFGTVYLLDPVAYDAQQFPHVTPASVRRSAPTAVDRRALFGAPAPQLPSRRDRAVLTH